jgi:uncharacterized membrane protein YphA (DoxX/SURF4 family)
MSRLIMLAQMLIALSVLNIWVLRAKRASSWRGGSARSLREEFEVYGLPGWFMTTTGVVKVTFAAVLLAGLWRPELARPAALGLALFMAGAVAMHIKVADPWRKSIPAFSLGALATVVALA